MTIRTRIVLGLSAAALSLSLALAPAAFAQDKMGKDDGMMKKDTMSKDGMKKDTMSKDDGMKKDTHVEGWHEERRRHDEEELISASCRAPRRGDPGMRPSGFGEPVIVRAVRADAACRTVRI